MVVIVADVSLYKSQNELPVCQVLITDVTHRHLYCLYHELTDAGYWMLDASKKLKTRDIQHPEPSI